MVMEQAQTVQERAWGQDYIIGMCSYSCSVYYNCEFVFLLKVLDVVTFLDSHDLAAGGDKVTDRYAAISRHYNQLRGQGQST